MHHDTRTCRRGDVVVREHVYRCGSRNNSMVGRCGKSISAALAEDVAMARWLAMQGAVLHGAVLDDVEEAVRAARPTRERKPTRDAAAERRLAVERTEAAIARVIDRLAAGGDPEVFDRAIAKLEARLADQRAALAEVVAEPKTIPAAMVPLLDDVERLRDGLREWVERVEVFPAAALGGRRDAQFRVGVDRVRVRWIAPVEDDAALVAGAEVLYPRFAPAPGVHWIDRWPEVVRLLGDLVPLDDVKKQAAALLR
jgi:hypothetical protein